MKKEEHYICEHCGTLTTQTNINDEMECGSIGMCDCQFTEWFWNTTINNLDVDTPRIYNDYTTISKEWHDVLFKELNTVLRLQMFNEIPKEKRTQ